MSSQRETGISLNHAPGGVGYKLLELPPELLTLLESDTPPVLTLESSTNSAILKNGTQSWGLRQKNTSNALILLKASSDGTTPSSSEVPEASLNAIATIHDTIELAPELAVAAPPVAKGKWHEKFARGR
ncbi:hypothetical protein F5Y00DRAFT_262060 [Daldinia vernicosa]|uniref:uncharacterized protein n=1 Tax=Daldinia vernicosa TaxID=114800 RepID=UPI002007A468|nr:uncharacterized protein F5Y00DRAFT_262060 [Daldinia vernicosa]KAI0848904.1 hypothetical protein F5Y00DRAFT_262060 [Daldinia vernicosa]